MRVFVVGHRGMLGHVVARYLTEQRVEVQTSEQRYTGVKNDHLIAAISQSRADWIVNAAVKTPNRAANRRELFLVNTQLPIHLKSVIGLTQKLIHASTDGVFSGRKGNYSVEDSPDAEDDYGLSKSLAEIVAERDKAFVIRCSIVGPDPANGRGLMAWLLKQTSEVEGFTNQYWNGITTLEWAKICLQLMNGNLPTSHAIVQPGPTALSKFELLKTIATVYSIPTKITAKPGPEALNRTLVPNLPTASLSEQLKELRSWY
jgi:dTDP-4-dehydrorhamnose reductase